MKRILSATFAFLLVLSAFSQSRTELIQYGDLEFKNKNYTSAAYFYLKSINESGGREKDVVYPYELKESQKYIINKKPDSLKTTDTEVEKADSAMADFQVDEEKIDPNKDKRDYAIHQIAECYRLGRDYEKAEEWFKRSKENKPRQFKAEQVYYAECLIMNKKYDLALNELEQYTDDEKNKGEYAYDRAQQLLFNANYAQDPNNIRTDITVNQMDTNSFNRGSSNFAASFYEDYNSLLISSGRVGNMLPEKEKNANPENYSDIYITRKVDGKWDTLVQNFGEPVNSAWNEGAAVLSVDRTSLYFTRWNPVNKNECAIWVCKKFNGIWMQPLKLGNSVNVDGYSSMHPMLSEEGDVLYYASDRPNGYGKMDIWYCTINEYGELGEPTNIGSDINTRENEGSPFFHYYTNTLFFSSEGHTGMGGLDIFRSKFSEDDSIWANPINLGQPINSNRDDLFYILDKDQTGGYFTSDRENCNDCNGNGGYCHTLYELGQPELEFSISGYVYNAETEEIIPNALITFKDVTGSVEPFFLMTDDKGYYQQELKPEQHFFMKAQKVKFFGDAATVSTIGLTASQEFLQDFYLTPIPAGEIEIPGIEYDYDKATLRPESKKILDDLVEFLNLNDNLVIEIRSHTDSRGNDGYNQRLSEQRAKSCVDYLTANGIPRDRMIPIGFGETQLLKDCAGVEGCGDTGDYDCDCHQRNRRTAFKPIAQDYIDIESTGGNKSGGFKFKAPPKKK